MMTVTSHKNNNTGRLGKELATPSRIKAFYSILNDTYLQ